MRSQPQGPGHFGSNVDLAIMQAACFVVKRANELPEIWRTPPSQEWLSQAATATGVPVEQLTSRVCFELPDCTLARRYMQHVKAASESGIDAIQVCLTNHTDYDAAHGEGESEQALHHMHAHGIIAASSN